MVDLSYTEENYLKALMHLLQQGQEQSMEFEGVGTNELAQYLEVKPATVSDMLKRLRAKSLIHYERYKKIRLTEDGRYWALRIIRKHRLWESFLALKLGFSWDEVHEVAEQLEHIRSPKLIERLDAYLGHPKYDPHGDPIPQPDGSIPKRFTLQLGEGGLNQPYTVVAVRDNSAEFLKYASQLGLELNADIQILEKISFDQSMRIRLKGIEQHISGKFASQVIISPKNTD